MADWQRVAPESFGGQLDDELRAALEAAGTVEAFPRGRRLIAEGDGDPTVYVLLRGRAKVSATGAAGEATLAFRGPGDVVGEPAAFGARTRAASVTAVERVQALALTGAALHALMDHHPKVGELLFATVSERLRDADSKRAEFAGSDTVARLAARLLELADEHGMPTADGVVITLPVSQSELATWVGASRESVSRALATLRSIDAIAVERGGIVVRDRERLSQRAV